MTEESTMESPPYTESTVEGHIIVECPDCSDAMLLGEMWWELIDEGHGVPSCPDCEPDEWADHAEPKIDGVEVWALAE